MARQITAKAALGSMIQYPRTDGVEGDYFLSFYPDYSDGRNKEWAAASPSLNFQIVVRPDVAKLFEQGGKYTVTFEKQDEDEKEVPDGSDSPS